VNGVKYGELINADLEEKDDTDRKEHSILLPLQEQAAGRQLSPQQSRTFHSESNLMLSAANADFNQSLKSDSISISHSKNSQNPWDLAIRRNTPVVHQKIKPNQRIAAWPGMAGYSFVDTEFLNHMSLSDQASSCQQRQHAGVESFLGLMAGGQAARVRAGAGALPHRHPRRH
jgi:hypothetical protein